MKKSKWNPATAFEPINPENSVNFVFNVEGMDAELDGNGNLTLRFPFTPVGMFTKEIQDNLVEQFGTPRADSILDEAAGVIQTAFVSEYLASRMR
jgi:hypothetical protein